MGPVRSPWSLSTLNRVLPLAAGGGTGAASTGTSTATTTAGLTELKDEALTAGEKVAVCPPVIGGQT